MPFKATSCMLNPELDTLRVAPSASGIYYSRNNRTIGTPGTRVPLSKLLGEISRRAKEDGENGNG